VIASNLRVVTWVCPFCHGALHALRCESCNESFSGATKQPDFRSRTPRTLRHEWTYDPRFGHFPWERASLSWPDAGNGLAPDPSWQTTERKMFASMPRAERTGALALDIGCGHEHQRFRTGLARLGYAPIGLDVDGSAPDALADAHFLPLPDGSIDLVTSSAVWEHLKHPHHAMREAARVLAAGGRLVFSIAFGEPFHISYFHHSPLAAFELANSVGLEVHAIVLSDEYSAYYAHWEMGFAGVHLPAVAQRGLAWAIRALALSPAVAARLVGGNRAAMGRAKFAFARSHSASVGLVAEKPRTS